MYAIIETGGKQYKVSELDVIKVEKLDAAEGEEIKFDVVALGTDDGFKVGKPLVDGASVTATVLKTGKEKKLHVMKYKPKKNEKKKIGHRQPFTQVQIKSIQG